MFKSYEAIYEAGQVKWLTEQPDVISARIIVTVLEENPLEEKPLEESPVTKPVKRRMPPAALAGKVKILGDIVGPIVDEDDWECLK